MRIFVINEQKLNHFVSFLQDEDEKARPRMKRGRSKYVPAPEDENPSGAPAAAAAPALGASRSSSRTSSPSSSSSSLLSSNSSSDPKSKPKKKCSKTKAAQTNATI